MKQINIKDFEEFCEKYHPSLPAKSQKFKLRPYQIDIIRAMQNQDYTIIGKSRQMGLSILFQLYSAYLLLYGKSIFIEVIGHNQYTSEHFINNVRTIIQKVYTDINPPYSINNKQAVVILNNKISIYRQHSEKNEYKHKILIGDEAVYIKQLKSIIENELHNKYILYSSSIDSWSPFQ